MDIKTIINDFYQQEAEDSMHEATNKMLSIAVPIDEAAMLKAIAERFGRSLSSFAGEMLTDLTKEAFLFLSPTDKELLAVKADREVEEYLRKKDIDFEWLPEGRDGGYGRWQSYSAICNRAEEDQEKNQ